jgi:hypothetical protein
MSLTDRNSVTPSSGTSAYCLIPGRRGDSSPIQRSGPFYDQVRSVPKVLSLVPNTGNDVRHLCFSAALARRHASSQAISPTDDPRLAVVVAPSPKDGYHP